MTQAKLADGARFLEAFRRANFDSDAVWSFTDRFCDSPACAARFIFVVAGQIAVMLTPIFHVLDDGILRAVAPYMSDDDELNARALRNATTVLSAIVHDHLDDAETIVVAACEDESARDAVALLRMLMSIYMAAMTQGIVVMGEDREHDERESER